MNRRRALQLMGAGFGMVGLADVLHGAASAGSLAAKQPHFPPRAKNVIFLFLNGGLSHLDTFDPKPELTRRDGQPMPGPKIKTDRAAGNLMASPFTFKKYGQSGIEVSEIFPRIAATIDDFCVVRSCYSDNGNHTPSLFMMNCGHQLTGRPSLGAWVTYGLGTENQNLPGFVVLCPGMPNAGPPLWSSAFLPSSYQGVYIPLKEREVEKQVPNIRNARGLSGADQERQLRLLNQLNRVYVDRVGPQPELESSIQAMEIAYRMQSEVPEVFDIGKETEKTRARYGDSEFGRGVLMALRLAERGVRMVQVYFGNFQPWDSHDDIRVHARLAKDADCAIAALIEDLKARGLFNQTLVMIGSEFGRTPMIQVSGLEKLGKGRDHNIHGFTTLFAGGGVQGGTVYGATDDLGLKAVENPVHVHDIHATVLHLLGLDHTRLTFRHSGRDYRLTDVHGNVVKGILA
jgi:Protein of unknown function (DUF1501)